MIPADLGQSENQLHNTIPQSVTRQSKATAAVGTGRARRVNNKRRVLQRLPREKGCE